MSYKNGIIHLIKYLSRDLWSIISIFIIVLFSFIALSAYVISPDSTENSNQMHLSINSAPSLFSIQMIQIPREIKNQKSFFSQIISGQKSNFNEVPIKAYKLKDDYILVNLYPSGLEKKIPLKAYSNQEIKQIEQEYIYKKTFYLGTDKYGRDILSRLILGTRISLSIGVIAVLISFFIGVFMGGISGYFGGRVDKFIMWIINVTWSIPTLLLVMAITLVLGKGFWQVFIAVGLTMWVEVARVVRGQFLSIKESDYIKAAKVLGFSNFRIITKHLLPNAMPALLVVCATNFASAILIESGLSFLGLGTQPPTPSWGSIIKQQYANIVIGKPMSAIAPGICIIILVTAIMICSNKLQSKITE